ncbi:MAG: FHIPEP family type III secretion protein [Nevskiales bacterium]
MEPGLADTLMEQAAAALERQEAAGEPPVLLVPGVIRQLLSRMTRASIPGLHVLAYHELPEGKNLRLVETIGDPANQAA